MIQRPNHLLSEKIKDEEEEDGDDDANDEKDEKTEEKEKGNDVHVCIKYFCFSFCVLCFVFCVFFPGTQTNCTIYTIIKKYTPPHPTPPHHTTPNHARHPTTGRGRRRSGGREQQQR